MSVFSLNMFGHIDSVFQSLPAQRKSMTGGGYDPQGRWVDGTEVTTSHVVNIQPLNKEEIDILQIGADRIKDYRKIYINDGSTEGMLKRDIWTFTGLDGEFKIVSMDNRYYRNYCKCIVARVDA